MTQESLTEKLAAHLMRPVDEPTRQRARLHLLDWLGCVAGALKTDSEERTALTYNRTAGWMGNLLEMDDVHREAILHPGPVIWPSVTKEGKFAMDEALDKAVRGYEAMISIGATFDRYHYEHWHPTSTAGIFGATVSEAFELQTISYEHLVNALGLAGSVSGGFWRTRHEGDDAKQFHIVNAIHTGYIAATAAKAGAKGPRFILEGEQGLYAATCKNPRPMALPEHWRIHEVSFKPWGACRHAHPAIDAAMELKARLGALNGDIIVETYSDAINFCDRPDPQNKLDAKFSIQHAIAIVAQSGAPELADFEPEAIAGLSNVRANVKVQEAVDISARYPKHYGARITCGGETVELIDTLGDPERPMSMEQIIGKARALIYWGGLPDQEADRAIDIALYGDETYQINAMLGDWLS